MNVYMYVVSVDYHYGILFVVICVLLRDSGMSGRIGGMVGYMYCMLVE